MFNNLFVKVSARIYILAYSEAEYRMLLKETFNPTITEDNWYDLNRHGFSNKKLAEIAGGEDNLIMLRFGHLVSGGDVGRIDAISISDYKVVRKFEHAEVLDVELIFASKNTLKISEADEIWLRMVGSEILCDYADRLGAFYVEINAIGRDTNRIFLPHSALFSCDPEYSDDSKDHP